MNWKPRFRTPATACCLALCCLVWAICVTVCYSQEATDSPRKLVVATKEAPPFAIKDEDGRWTGVSIDLWRDIANELKLDYEFREMDLVEMLTALRDGSCDVAVAALTVTNQRERDIDFTHPYFTSGLGIAVAPEQSAGSLNAVFGAMMSPEFLEILGLLLFVLLAMGFLIWFFERRKNKTHFGGSVAKGLGSGFWWSAVTMTTVGYGDKAPVTLGGRFLAIIWMFTSLFIISFFTASVASLILVDRLESRVGGLQDLPHVRVASIRGSTSETYLRRQRIRFRSYDKPKQALQALRDGQLDAVVYDAPILRYAISQQFRDTLAVLPMRFETQNYCIGLPNKSELREPVNQSLLRITSEPAWQNTLYRYLGE